MARTGFPDASLFFVQIDAQTDDGEARYAYGGLKILPTLGPKPDY